MTDLELVAAELAAAKQKHPHFVDYFATNSLHADADLQCSRVILHGAEIIGNVGFADVLQCELDEAFQAYAHGELAHARQELAQCAAVCIRGMEYIEKEKTELHTTKETTND